MGWAQDQGFILASYWPMASDEARVVWERFEKRKDVQCRWLSNHYIGCTADYPKGAEKALQRGNQFLESMNRKDLKKFSRMIHKYVLADAEENPLKAKLLR